MLFNGKGRAAKRRLSYVKKSRLGSFHWGGVFSTWDKSSFFLPAERFTSFSQSDFPPLIDKSRFQVANKPAISVNLLQLPKESGTLLFPQQCCKLSRQESKSKSKASFLAVLMMANWRASYFSPPPPSRCSVHAVICSVPGIILAIYLLFQRCNSLEKGKAKHNKLRAGNMFIDQQFVRCYDKDKRGNWEICLIYPSLQSAAYLLFQRAIHIRNRRGKA